jgi:hypothetical protein
MKKIIILIVLLSLMVNANLYNKDSLTVDLSYQGNFDLISSSNNYNIEEVNVKVYSLPEEDFRQKMLSFNSQGKLENDYLYFQFNDKTLGTKNFNYNATIKTINSFNTVHQKINYPFTVDNSLTKYVQPTETIDSDHEHIVNMAVNLANNEDDLFVIVFNLAKWVEENIEYDLNSLTVEGTQKASWVLNNRQGVCDEISTLFVAMCRSLNIPAKTVSGMSYTTSELFTENWQAHSWAEVYFPTYGWVSFDITFNEYGYVDVTHIKFQEHQSSSTQYQWVGNNVEIKNSENKFNAQIVNQGDLITESDFNYSISTLADLVGFGSYNEIFVKIKNNQDYYQVSSLKIALPKEIELISPDKKIVLLKPNQEKEVSWIVKVPSYLDHSYIYNFPIVVYNEKNVSITSNFNVKNEQVIFKEDEVSNQDTEQNSLDISCDYLKSLPVGETNNLKCKITNPNQDINNLEVCLNEKCDLINLKKSASYTINTNIEINNSGWQKVWLTLKSGQLNLNYPLSFLVLDESLISLILDYPPKISLNDDFKIKLILEKVSVNNPKNIKVNLEGYNFNNRWDIDELESSKELELNIKQMLISKNNEFKIILDWEDDQDTYHQEHLINIEGEAKKWSDNLFLYLNQFLKLFYIK